MNTLDKTTMTRWDAPKVRYFGVPLEKSAKSDDGTITVRGYFTSDSKDMMGDMITRGATERAVPAYRRWGNIRYMHQPKPVAKVVRIGTEDGLDWNEVEIKVIDPQAKFEVENGLLAALSVGILINFDDIEFLEDGGLLINDYLLAEISLVDHPANYDAALTGLKSLFEGIASLDKVSAMRTLDEMKAALIQGDEPMTEETVVEKTEESVVEEVVEEQLPVETETTPVETAPVEKSADEPVEETPEAPAADPVLEALNVLTVKVAEIAAQITESFTALSASLAEALAKSPEVAAEAQVAAEQTVDEEKTVAPEKVEEEVAEEPGLPVNRTAAVLPTELPVAEDEPEVKEEKPKDLRSALRKYFESKNTTEVKNG